MAKIKCLVAFTLLACVSAKSTEFEIAEDRTYYGGRDRGFQNVVYPKRNVPRPVLPSPSVIRVIEPATTIPPPPSTTSAPAPAVPMAIRRPPLRSSYWSRGARPFWRPSQIIYPAPVPAPTIAPTLPPTMAPMTQPTMAPTPPPTIAQTLPPTTAPTLPPTMAPTPPPTMAPTPPPTMAPTPPPTMAPTPPPTMAPTPPPTMAPTPPPTMAPTPPPTMAPTPPPTMAPTPPPTMAPTPPPTMAPTLPPTKAPMPAPTMASTSLARLDSRFGSMSTPQQSPYVPPSRQYPVYMPEPPAKPALIAPPANKDGRILPGYVCGQSNAYYVSPDACDLYVECKDSIAVEYTCPDGLQYNSHAVWPEYPCDYASLVKCTGKSVGKIMATSECSRQYGYFPSFSDCTKYMICQEGMATAMSCPSGLAFNPTLTACDWPENVPTCDPEVFRGFTCPSIPLLEDGSPSDMTINYRYGNSCKQYVACHMNRPRLLSCDEGMLFDHTLGYCLEAEYVTNCGI